MVEGHHAGLPVHLTSLIGREREIADVCALLSQDGVRLVTLTGPGGVGKTRVAIAAAQQFSATSKTRATFVDLTPLAHSDLVLQAIAQATGVRELVDVSLETSVCQALATAPSFLLLDNFEHVINAAPLLVRMLIAVPSLTLLVTSRERIRLSGEQEFEVSPLTVPEPGVSISPEVAMQSEALQLFAERARSVKHDFEVSESNTAAISAVCTYLDGLPLAIELAAARINALPPAMLLTRLEQSLTLLTGGSRDRPFRHQTMRDAIAWSYALLTPEEQVIFRELAIFAGGCTVEAAESVVSIPDVLNEVASLVDKSLVRQEGQPDQRSRFKLLQTVREFGLEQLEAAGEAESSRERHARFYLELAEGKDPAIPVSGDFAWIARLSPEVENLRLALEWYAARGDDLRLLRLAMALGGFWLIRGQYDEGRRWIRLSLNRNPNARVELRASAFQALGAFAFFQGNYEDARSCFSTQGELVRFLGSSIAMASANHFLGIVAYRTGEFELADSLMSKGLEMLLELEPEVAEAPAMASLTLSVLGDTALTQGHVDSAADYYKQALDRARSLNYTWVLIDALGGLGVVEMMRGNLLNAEAHYLESLELGFSNNDLQHIASILSGLAVVSTKRGQPERAVRLLGTAEALRERIGTVVYPRDKAIVDHCVEGLRAEIGEKRFAALHATGKALTPLQVHGEALSIRSAEARAASIASPDPSHPYGLSARELEVLLLLVDGLSDNAIAERLFISRRTVTTHTSSIFGKLDVAGRAEAAAAAVRRGLV